MAKRNVMLAILHDGTFDGDSAFYVECGPSTSTFHYNGETLTELKEMLATNIRKDYGKPESEDEKIYLEIEVNDMVDAVKGAWIVDSKGIDILDVATDIDCGNDSATYQCNRTAKRLAQSVAVKILGRKVRQ